MRFAPVLFALALVPLYACTEDAQGLGDSGTEPADLGAAMNDAQAQDGTALDLGTPDGGDDDAGAIDSGSVDGGELDGGNSDAADSDAADSDAADPDAAPADAGDNDAGDNDAGDNDAGPIDAGPPVVSSCVGQPDNTLCSNDPLQAERCLAEVCVGTYVAPSGDTNNPGTRLLPKPTIAAGLGVAHALPGYNVVYVAKDIGTINAIYAENLQLVADDHISGGWQRDNAGNYDHDVAAYETRIVPSDPQGVTLTGGTTINLTVFGFRITSVASALVTSALNVVSGSAALGDLIVTGAPGGDTSRAIEIAPNASATLLRVNAGGGQATAFSFGLECPSCPGLVVENSTLAGSIADMAVGLSLSGDTSNVFVHGSRLIGGVIGNGGAPPSVRAGVRLSGCTSNGALISRSLLRGQLGPGTSGTVSGVGVEGSCSVELSGSTAIGLSYPPGPTAAEANQAYGVLCLEAGTRCLLHDNLALIGVEEVPGGQGSASATTLAVGAVFGGSGEVTSDGPRGLQRLSGGPGGGSFGLLRTSINIGVASGTLIVRRAWMEAGTCTNTMPNSNAIAALLSGAFRIENSVLLGGDCTTAGGALVLATAAIAATSQELIHNHIVSGRGAGNHFGAMITTSAGAPIRTGVLANNTIVGNTGVAVGEAVVNADWDLVYGNNLSGTVLYIDEGSTGIVDIAVVNGLVLEPSAQNNISAAPMVDATFHLLTGSPNLGAGVAVVPGHTLPAVDMDGQNRPNPANSNPDIGPDERP